MCIVVLCTVGDFAAVKVIAVAGIEPMPLKLDGLTRLKNFAILSLYLQ